LFGHEAGAFTGATRGGRASSSAPTAARLFLDEIASASMAVQEKILRVVEYGEFQRLGASTTIKVDVRLVAATNVDLPSEAANGKFRADLLDRLAFDVVTVPPLRERPGDILLLARHFGLAMAQEIKLPVFPASRPAGRADSGNLCLARQCPRTEERGRTRGLSQRRPRRADRPIILDPFESAFRPRATCHRARPSTPRRQRHRTAMCRRDPYDFFAHIAAIEQEALKVALANCGGNQKRTAVHLGLAYHQLRNLLRKHGMFGVATANSPQSDDTMEEDEQND
jgi:psp operon transcriptional activator